MSFVGSYSLIAVDGRRVPAVWEESVGRNGDAIQSVWTGGRAVFRPEGEYSVVITSLLRVGGRSQQLGPHAAEGSWRARRDGCLELRSTRGTRSCWRASPDHAWLTVRSRSPERTTFVFRRDEGAAA